MKEKNGFFAKTENKVEKYSSGVMFYSTFREAGNTEKTACTENGRT